MSQSQTIDGIHFYLPSFAGGGAERVFVRLANHIAERGRVVHLVVNSATGPLRDLVSDKVQLHVLGRRKAVFAMPRLVAHLRVHRPAVLISALTRTNITALVAARLALAATPVIACERNQFSVLCRNYGPIRRVLITAAVRWLYPSARAVIGNTAEVTRDIAAVARLDIGKVGVIHNPAPELLQLDLARADPANHPWFAEDSPVAIAIGRLMPQKDYPTMLRAVAQSGSDLRLLLLGEGPEREALEAEAVRLGIADRVDFVGFRLDRFSYLVRARLFLISSITEGFPNALIEAVAAGVPAISTDCAGGGAREILGSEFPDRIVPVGDAAALADVIRRVLDADTKIDLDDDQMRLARITERYQIGQVADAFLARAAA